MSPKEAQKIALVLTVANWVFLLIALTVVMFIVVDSLVETPETTQILKEIQMPKRKAKATAKISGNICWQLDILEKKPVKKPVRKIVKPKIVKIKPPFDWISVSIHSNPKKSSAFIRDKRKNSQIVVSTGQQIQGSQYTVAQINATKIVLKINNNIAVIKKPIGK